MSLSLGYTYSLSPNNAIVSSVSGTTNKGEIVTIPASVVYNSQTYSVVGINITSSTATINTNFSINFSNATNLTSITSLGALNNELLSGSLSFPNSLTTISANVFKNCIGLSGALNLANVTSIGASAFEGCFNIDGQLTLNTTPGGLTSIPQFAFKGCTKLTLGPGGSLNLSNITTIGNSAFQGCSGLNGSLILNTSGGLTTIPQFAFGGCSQLTTPAGNLDLSKITSFGEGAFQGCTSLNGNLILNTNLTSIVANLFSGCSSLSGTLNLSNVTNIGEGTFFGCSGFSGPLVFNSSLTTIPASAFFGCSGFTGDLNLANVTSFGSSAFQNCSNLDGNLILNSSVGGLTSIPSFAFAGCSNLKGSLNLSNITNLGSNAFQGCSNLDGYLTLNTSGTLTTISNFVFANCSKLKNIGDFNLSKIKTLGSNCFENCSNLSGNLILNNVAEELASIPLKTFFGCSGFTGNLSIKNIVSLDQFAFAGCTGLNSIIFGNVLSLYSSSLIDVNAIFVETSVNENVNIQIIMSESGSTLSYDALPENLVLSGTKPNYFLSGAMVKQEIFDTTFFINTDLKGPPQSLVITFDSQWNAICLLSDCDILLSDMTYKNITKLSLHDQVLGYFSQQPQKIKQILRHTHALESLQETNKPYLIKKDVFGQNVPDKDIHISGHHRIILEKEKNNFIGIQTFKLNQGKKAMIEDVFVSYYHILLENQGEGIIVNNLPVEDCLI